MASLLPLGLAASTVVGLALVVMAWRADRRAPTPALLPGLLAGDTLVYVLGVNLAFLAQELGLVLSKAFLPGVTATLFHNSHDWTGDHPDLALSQGGGTVGLLIAATLGWLVAVRTAPGSLPSRAGWWTVFHGSVAFAISIVAGLVDDTSEAGASLDALGVSGSSALVVGVVALLAVPLIGLQLGPVLAPVRTDDGTTPFAVARRCILAPAALAVPVIALFRFPSLEQGLAGLLLLIVAVPWAVLGAAGAPLVSSDAGPQRAEPGWTAAAWATVASLVVALLLVPGLTVG